MCTSTLQISNKSIQTKDKMDSRSKCDVIAPFSLKFSQATTQLKFEIWKCFRTDIKKQQELLCSKKHRVCMF